MGQVGPGHSSEGKGFRFGLDLRPEAADDRCKVLPWSLDIFFSSLFETVLLCCPGQRAVVRSQLTVVSASYI